MRTPTFSAAFRMALTVFAGPLLVLAIVVLGAALRTPSLDSPMQRLLEDKQSIALVGIFALYVNAGTGSFSFLEMEAATFDPRFQFWVFLASRSMGSVLVGVSVLAAPLPGSIMEPGPGSFGALPALPGSGAGGLLRNASASTYDGKTAAGSTPITSSAVRSGSDGPGPTGSRSTRRNWATLT